MNEDFAARRGITLILRVPFLEGPVETSMRLPIRWTESGELGPGVPPVSETEARRATAKMLADAIREMPLEDLILLLVKKLEERQAGRSPKEDPYC